MAHGVVRAPRRLTEAPRSTRRSQRATAVAESSSTVLPRHRRLSAVRAQSGEFARIPRSSPRTQVSGLHGGASPGLAVARRQGPIRGSRIRNRSGRDRISARIRSASGTRPAVSSAIASTRRGSGSAGMAERLRISLAKSDVVFMGPLGSRETASVPPDLLRGYRQIESGPMAGWDRLRRAGGDRTRRPPERVDPPKAHG